MSQSGQPWGARAAGWSEAGVRGEAGFAARLPCVCTHTLAHACCLGPLTHSDPSFAPREQGGPKGGPGGGGKTRGCGAGEEVAGLALSPAAAGYLQPPREGME